MAVDLQALKATNNAKFNDGHFEKSLHDEIVIVLARVCKLLGWQQQLGSKML